MEDFFITIIFYILRLYLKIIYENQNACTNIIICNNDIFYCEKEY